MRALFFFVGVFGVCAAARPPCCFTAHAKRSLQCTEPLPPGTSVSVYDDGESPQRGRKLFYSKGGKLCASSSCKKCMAPGGEWAACGKAPTFPVHVMGANGDWAKPKAVLFAAVVVAVPLVIFAVAGGGGGAKKAAPAAPSAPAGAGAAVVAWLVRFAGASWFFLVPAAGTAINMFTIIFTGATVILFLAALLGRKRTWVVTALANAAGATLGSAVLLLLIRERGIEYLNETFPAVLASPAWAKAMGWMQTYGLGGMFLVSCLPIILHPVIVFGLLSGMSNATILAIVMSGRTVKYLVMGYVTVNVPSALKYFGIKGALVEYATSATAGDAASSSTRPTVSYSRKTR